MEQPESSLPYSQAPATCPYPEPAYIYVYIYMLAQDIYIYTYIYIVGWYCMFRLFAKLRKQLLASSSVSVCVPPWYTSDPTGRIFILFDILIFLENTVRHSKFDYNLRRMTRSLHEDVCAFMSVSRWSFKMRNISDYKFVEKFKKKDTFYIQ